MIRNLDYNWQNATNIVLVNNNNRGSATAASTTTATVMGVESPVGGASEGSAMVMTTTKLDANGGSHNAICNNNNNDDGFGDKNYASVSGTAASVPTSATLGGTLVTLVHGGDGATGLPKIVKIVATKPQQRTLVTSSGRPSTVIVTMAADKTNTIGIRKDIVVNPAPSNTIDELTETIKEEKDDIIVEEDHHESIDASLEAEKVKVTPTKASPRSTLTPNTSSSNNSSFDEAAITAGGSATSSPDHHARRPMNAFLIFCKKHRPIVREKYPNLENRAITKILGDWWANLDNKDQDPFKSLASNYKDAFLNANPNFKWYKLPAPPLRTLSTRPTNSDRSYGDLLTHGLAAASITKSPSTPTKQRNFEDAYQEGMEVIDTPVHGNRRRALKSNIQLFKLADENQMGGLSNLMAMGQQPGTILSKINDNNNNNSGTLITDHQEMVHYDADDLIIDESAAAEEPFANMRTHAAQMEVTPKRKLVDVHSEFQAMKRAKKRADYLESAVASATTVAGGSTGEESPVSSVQKSSRACKGKKYQEFFKSSKAMAALTPSPPESPTNGQQSVIIRTQQLIMQPVGFPHNGYCKPQKKNDATDIDIDNETVEVKTEDTQASEEGGLIVESEADKMDPNSGKLFDASDFELDSKIIALPALSLDTYLTRKRETKKKKKIGGKGKSYTKKHHNGPTIQEVKEAKQKSMVGSQKRKARKESITRRDVNTVTPATEGQPGDGNAGNTSDLFILATLAELQQ